MSAFVANTKDFVVDNILQRNYLSKGWKLSKKGMGMVVLNAFIDYPAPGQGDPTCVEPCFAYYKWDGKKFIKMSDGAIDTDQVVDSVVARNTMAAKWGFSKAGSGVLVNNAFVDFPAAGQGDPTVKTPGINAYYKWSGTAFIKISDGESANNYTGVSPSTVPWGGIPANTDLTGRSLNKIVEQATVVFLIPAFSSFSLTGQATTIEVGDKVTTGNKTFTWGTTNAGNVKPNSVVIRNVTTLLDLVVNLANDGSEVVNVPASVLNANGKTQVYRVLAIDKQNTTFQADFTVTARYKIFFDSVASFPNSSVKVRALTSRFTNAGNTFILNTGTANNIFSVCLPSINNLVNVIDLDALNADITAQYTLSLFNVNDAGGNAVAYKIYVMTQAVANSTNHRHQITIS